MASLTVHRGPGQPGHFPWSSFASKLELRLRLDGVAYTAVSGTPPSSGPRGKIPYIELSEAGKTAEKLGDSTLIARRLVHDGLLRDLNAGLAPAQRLLDLGLRALVEDRLYFYNVREKWCDNYYSMRDAVLGSLPWPLRWLVGILASRSAVRTLFGQGTLRFSPNEIVDLRTDAWTDINAQLAEARARHLQQGDDDGEPFWALGGDAPTEADTTLFGFLTSCLVSTASPASLKMVRGFPVLLDYTRRIEKKYFPDYQSVADPTSEA